MPHHYSITVTWSGNKGQGTAGYSAYSREHETSAAGKLSAIAGSSDPAFRGDSARWNPEELLLASLSSCHMLWLLHLCADAGIVVTEYSDTAQATLAMNSDGSGQFAEVVLRPKMTITDGERVGEAQRLHHEAHEKCFIARSVNFPVRCEPEVAAIMPT